MKDIVEQWLERMRYDLSTARAMLKMRKYLYVAFMCQQAVEKAFKALLAKGGKRIPLIHGLRKLADLAGVGDDLDPEQIDLLEKLTPFAIKARYGSYKRRLSEICNSRTAKEFVHSTEKFIRWLEKRI